MQRFDLQCSRYYRTNDKLDRCINRWTADAVTHKVQEVYVQLFPDDDFEIPPCLCTCKSLTQLDLDITTVGDLEDVFKKIILPREMGLPRLKSLRLRLEQQSFVDETLTNKFFSSFPTLESLLIVFSGNCGFSNMNLRISLPELKHFEFNSNDEVCNSEVTLHAPSLSSFIFKSYASTSFILENLASLVTADIEVSINGEVQVPRNYGAVREEKKELYAQRFMRFFIGLHKVKVLKLGQSFVKALGGAPHILDTQLIDFSNLRSLKMRTFLSWDCLHSIFYLLKISPNIESVSLKLCKQNCDMPPPVYPFCDEVKINPENIGDYWDARLSLPCMMCHLKFVEIEHLGGCVNELKFLEILLKHAMVLEKVVLRSYSSKQDSEREIRMAKFGEMLLGFPRASKYMIILCKF